MKRGLRILCLLLIVALLMGCAPQGENTPTTAAPESSGAVLGTEATQPKEAVKTRQALELISALGESPDDNYRTW